MAIELTDELMQLERDALDAHAAVASPSPPEGAWGAWREASAKIHAAIMAHAAATGQSRMGVEMAVKKAVRHPEA